MFGPNNRPKIHHREPAFSDLYISTTMLFKEKFDLDDSWDVFIVTGSGTVANETILYSIAKTACLTTTGEFSQRMKDYLLQHGKYSDAGPFRVSVAYETALSQLNGTNLSDFSDCVSAFPYYTPNTPIWTTVNSKQLGGSPGLSIICVKKERLYTDFMPRTESYMSLMKYKIKDLKGQTPHTPAISLIAELHDILDEFDLAEHRKMIDTRRSELENLLIEKNGLDDKSPIMGSGPVMTLYPTDLVLNLQAELELYYNGPYPQIFLWSGDDKEYEHLYKRIRELKGE